MDVINTVRQEAYTGENRCGPCTALNIGIAAVLGVIVSRSSKRSGIVVAGLSALCIYFRGYLVPGTPTLTKRYLPERVLRWFGKASTPDLDTGLDTEVASDRDATDDRPDGEQGPAIEVELTPEQYLLRGFSNRVQRSTICVSRPSSKPRGSARSTVPTTSLPRTRRV